MMNPHLIALLLLLLASFSASAAPLDLANDNEGTIGRYASVLKEGGRRLAPDEARQAYAVGKFVPSAHDYLSFGIGAESRWIRFEIANRRPVAVLRRLSIETAWLDYVELYFFHANARPETFHLGDARPFAERAVDSRFFAVEHSFAPGVTELYLRVETPDPMVLPIYLTSRQVMQQRELGEGYGYGFLYGGILALLLYNLMLFFGLRGSRYLFYSIYLSFFLLMNLSYTGHAYQWLWPGQPVLERWGNPVLMIAYAISGLLFATRFLETRSSFPRLHRLTISSCLGIATALVLSILAGAHQLALLLAFSFVLLYTVLMVLLGALSLHAGNQSAKYFLYASIIAAVGATVTALAVWGIIGFSAYAYHAVEFGTLVEAILLALALADRFRRSQEERLLAEQIARLDPLTGLNNRRAFSELVDKLWKTGVRNQHEMSLILLDIDGFKLINDSFGHMQGDKVLVHAARAIENSARSEDILARWGGEEFILFLPETALADAIAAAERIRSNIETLHVELDGRSLSFTASFGVAQFNSENDSLDALISSADDYLYRAKVSGRNRVCSALSE